MLTIKYTNQFKKDYKLMKKRNADFKKLEEVLNLLINEKPLPVSNKDHNLLGNYSGCRECHITPDWLLIYEVSQEELTLLVLRTGTHSDLF